MQAWLLLGGVVQGLPQAGISCSSQLQVCLLVEGLLPNRWLSGGISVSSEHLILSHTLGGLFQCVSKRRNLLVIRIVNNGHCSKTILLYRVSKGFPRAA